MYVVLPIQPLHGEIINAHHDNVTDSENRRDSADPFPLAFQITGGPRGGNAFMGVWNMRLRLWGSAHNTFFKTIRCCHSCVAL